MESNFDFSNEQLWTDQRLAERAKHLGSHVLLLGEQSSRYPEVVREMEQLDFELRMRALDNGKA